MVVAASSLRRASVQQRRLPPPSLLARAVVAPASPHAAARATAHGGSLSFAPRCCFSTTRNDDPWWWLKDPEHPKLQQFLKMERSYLSQQLNKPRFRKIERALYLELRRRLLREDFTIPERIGSYEYYMRQAPGENYQVYYRRHRATQVEETVLNQNRETAVAQEFHFVTAMKISHDERWLLLVMENENEECRAMLKDLRTQKLVALDNLQHVRNAEWCNMPNGNKCFYYTKVDGHRRPYAVYRYDCDKKTQELIYEEQDDGFFVDVSQTKDGKFVLINCNSKNTSDIYALASDERHATPQLLRKREPGTAYFADHADDRFYIVTNADQAQNYKIVSSQTTPSTSDSSSDGNGAWQTFLPESSDVKIEDVDLFKDYLVLYERVHSVPRIRVCPLTGDHPQVKSHFVPLPVKHEICRISPGVNRDYSAHSVRFSISTPLVPEIVYDYNMATRDLQVLKEISADKTNQVKAAKTTKSKAKRKDSSDHPAFNPDLYTCQRLYVPSTSSLGVDVPLTLVHRKDIELNGQNPTLLIGYGAYGTNLEAQFELEHLSLLERGWVIALAHARGGGELGLRWYRDGKGLHKRNTFDDYLSCTTHLLDQQFTNPMRLAGKGVSAGGLVMGYMANEYPSLFQAMILKVPFLDILETMQDPSLPLTVHEYEEWGNPISDPKVYEYIKSYAPCENMRSDQVYPSMFVTGSMNDMRVQFWEPVKWVYKLRQFKAKQQKQESVDNDKGQLLLLKVSEDDGHFGGGGRLEQLQESAMEMAFLYQALKLPYP